LLREFLLKELRGMYIGGSRSSAASKLRVIIKTSRPGVIIGRSGEGSTKMRNKIADFLQKKAPVPEIKLDIEEIRSPESNAAIVAYMVAEGFEKRMPFRRVLKQTIEKVMANRDVKGVRIGLSGMLGGGSMSRTETLRRAASRCRPSAPTSTLPRARQPAAWRHRHQGLDLQGRRLFRQKRQRQINKLCMLFPKKVKFRKWHTMRHNPKRLKSRRAALRLPLAPRA
jgi:hypothetical protein